MRAASIALLALAVAPAAAGAAPWSAPRSVTVSGLAREPVVALGGPDAAAVAYVRHLAGADRVELRRGTVDRLGTPTILDRDARHGLDSPTLTYAGHDALLVWRRFRDANTRVLELASVTRAGTVGGPRAITGPPNAVAPGARVAAKIAPPLGQTAMSLPSASFATWDSKAAPAGRRVLAPAVRLAMATV